MVGKRRRIVIATRNRGKVRELRALFRELPLDIVALDEIEQDLEDVEETGETFEENAFLKAHAAADRTGLTALADDSGLAVDRLSGAPGIYSARFAAGESGLAHLPVDEANNRLVLARLLGVPESERTARFRCALVLAEPHRKQPLHVAHGTIEGRIAFAPAGAEGFGYDPLFIPDGETRTLAELGAAFKRVHSHRARASRALFEYFRERV